ncbi:Nrap protein-domain-containing protein [Coprinopsis sp. MPI-PUGE-AT-0042]|nr:Nrap protein-domain-containing protein [Coprinopsis sp. MPI-PUGE-AT-0042]
MALPVKRKAAVEAGPRKTRRVSAEIEDDSLKGDEEVLSDGDGDEEGEEEEEEEEDEWGGVEVEASSMQVDTHPAGSKPVKPPTAEEMRAIREATDLYRSSSFKLQIDALLPNVRPKASRTAPLEQFLLNLHTFLSKLPSVSPQHPLAAAHNLHKKGVEVAYCLPLPTEETNWKVAFEKPTDITLVGSWPNKVAVKGKDGVEFGKGTRMCVRVFEDAGAFWVGLLDLLVSGEEAGGGGPGKKRPLGKGLSSYQLFKRALDCLAKQDWNQGLGFVTSATGIPYDEEEYRAAWRATLVDSASWLNLLVSVPTGSLALLRYEAAKTLETLNSASLAVDPFTEVFLQDHRDILTRFDVILRVDLSEANPKNPSVYGTLDRGSQHLHLLCSVDSLLHNALGNRTKAISLLSPTWPSTRPLTKAHPTPSSSVIFMGLILDPEHAFGWEVGESVVWDVKTADERAHVSSMVVRHFLSLHFGVHSAVKQEKAAMQGWQIECDALVRLLKEIGTRVAQSASASNTTFGFKGALQAFDSLPKSIKALDDHPDTPLPLASPACPHVTWMDSERGIFEDGSEVSWRRCCR